MNTNRSGSGGGGAYQDKGIGNTVQSFREVTRPGKWGATATGSSQGETSTVGTIYSAQLNERPNISNPRNRGPERAPSRSASTPIPMVMQGSRNTGRVA